VDKTEENQGLFHVECRGTRLGTQFSGSCHPRPPYSRCMTAMPHRTATPLFAPLSAQENYQRRSTG